MKLLAADRTLETAGLGKTGKFTIAATAKAFRLLVGQIYTDKVLAIVRELSTNAADAHADAKKPTVPFTVHLPNLFEPYFEVRDEGTGMAKDAVFGLYTTFFASSRDQSNDFGGCLGLGSKTPFAYGDQFSVESRYRGTLTTYAMFVDAAGTPSVTELSSKKTKEPDGLTVRLPVDVADHDTFAEKAATVLAVFRTRPVVIGRDTFAFETIDYTMEGPDYGLYKVSSRSSRVLMGDIAYPIDPYQLATGDARDLSDLFNHGIDLRVPLGTCDHTVGRDALAYDEKTKATVIAAARAALVDIAPRVADGVTQAKTLWQARQAYQTFKSGLWWRIGAKLPDTLQWNGQPATDRFSVSKYYDDGASVLFFRAARAVKGSETVVKYAREEYVEVNAAVPVYVRDVTGGAYHRLRHHLKERNKAESGWPAALLVEGPAEAVAKLLAETGMDEIAVPLSTLPVPPVNPRRAADRTKAAALVLELDSDTHYGRNANAKSWHVPDEPPDGGYYVIIENNKPIGGTNSRDLYDLRQELDRLATLSGRKPTLYGVRQKNAETLAKYTGWTPLRDAVAAALKAVTPAVRKRLVFSEARAHLDYYLKQVKTSVVPKGTALGRLGAKLVRMNTASDEDEDEEAAVIARQVTAAERLARLYHVSLYRKQRDKALAQAKANAKALEVEYKRLTEAAGEVLDFSHGNVFSNAILAEFVMFAHRRAARQKTTAEATS